MVAFQWAYIFFVDATRVIGIVVKAGPRLRRCCRDSQYQASHTAALPPRIASALLPGQDIGRHGGMVRCETDRVSLVLAVDECAAVLIQMGRIEVS